MSSLNPAPIQDQRSKGSQWLVTIYYLDDAKFGRIYTDREKAERFAARQEKSPAVKSTTIKQIEPLSIVR
jgi:hypothetical protein